MQTGFPHVVEHKRAQARRARVLVHHPVSGLMYQRSGALFLTDQVILAAQHKAECKPYMSRREFRKYRSYMRLQYRAD